MPETALTRDLIAGEALGILKTLRENARAGRSNKLADVKTACEFAVSVEFDTYFFFLRKFHFIGMDREACLQLTAEGEKVLDGEKRDRFGEAVQEYFASRLPAAEAEAPRRDTPPETELPTLEPEPEAAEAKPDAKKGPQVMEMEPPRPPRAPPPPPQPVSILGGQAMPQPTPIPSPPRRDLPLKPKEQDVPPPTPPRAPRASDEQPRTMESSGAKGQDIDLRYVKYDQMGQGPLGVVYRGRHTALGLDVCVKELKDIFGYFSFLQRGEVIKRLKKEICAQALIRHPGVVAVLDQNCDVARPYYVVELMTGGNLRQALDAAGGKGLEVPKATRIFLQLAYALRAAHAQGLTHGNLKPENVLFDHYGNARLSDFGLSRVIEVDPARGMPQVFVGTGGMGYMSPEQLARATKDGGATADVYSLGILLYEMLTGTLPGRRSPLPSGVNPQVPAKMDPIFDKMTQDRRESRYSDIEAVLGDFYAAFEGGEFLKKGDLILSSEGTPPAPAEPKAE